MSEVFECMTLAECLQTLAPMFFIVAAFVLMVAVVAVISLIVRAEVRNEAKCYVKAFVNKVRVASQFLF